ncbi:phosphoglycerate mutase [Clostridia bacterium]|nr:phosphoglycerate mutase [Clostridia bacterium]
MASILLIIDGMQDIEYPELGGQTPFGHARCSNILKTESTGLVGMMATVPPGYPPDSLYCISNILGVHRKPNGRAYFEALAVGVETGGGDLIMRCNIVRVEDGVVTSSCGAGLSEADMKRLALSTAGILPKGYRICHMSTYKNILVAENSGDRISDIKIFAPHQNIGMEFDKFLPSGNDFADALSEYIVKSHEMLKDYAILPWGESTKTQMPSFSEVHGVKGAAVCKTEIAVGIARSIGLYTPDILGTTGDADTDLNAKAEEAVKLMREYDFLLVHVNGADEAGHRKNPVEKSEFIGNVDKIIVDRLLSAMSDGDSLLVCSDHATVCRTGSHTDGPVNIWFTRKGKDLGGADMGTINGSDCVSVCRNAGA